MFRTVLVLAAALLAAAPAPAQDWAKKRLAKSPRHHDWIKVKHGSRDVNCFLVFPEVKHKATAVVVIHEIFGLTDWAESLADELAAAGYIAIAPDLLSGMGKGGKGTAGFSDRQETIQAIRSLPANQVTADLGAAADYVAKLPSCNGKVAVAGFCWGGGQSFRFATNNKKIKAAFVFYGPGPKDEKAVERIRCPVYGFYGGNDNRINAGLPETEKLMKNAGKKFEPVIYEGAGHGFMRAGEEPGAQEGNKKARDEAWKRWKKLLKQI
jgi:carboxymethylenebutenolidase